MDTDKRAIVLLPVTTDPFIEYEAYGLFTMERVLTIPSTRLVWTDGGAGAFDAVMNERFPCDDQSLIKYKTVRFPRNAGEIAQRNLPSWTIHGSIAAVVFRNPAWYRHTDDKAALDELYAMAKKSPVILARMPCLNRLRAGFIRDYQQDTRNNTWNVLRFDRTKWEEQQACKKKRTKENKLFPPGTITVHELKQLILSMELTLREGLASKLLKDSYFRINVKYANRRKKEICSSLINIYEIGKTAYGKNFWIKARAGMGFWNGRGYKNVNVAKDIADRWKKEKPAAPKDKQAKKVAAIIKEIAKAKLFEKGVSRHTYRLHR